MGGRMVRELTMHREATARSFWRCAGCGNTVETTGQTPTLRCKCGMGDWERDAGGRR